MATKAEIKKFLVGHATNEGSGFSSWYAGITKNIDQRLHGDHEVPKPLGEHWWAWHKTNDDDQARAVESELHHLGFDGGGSGGDKTIRYVYIYKKTSKTSE